MINYPEAVGLRLDRAPRECAEAHNGRRGREAAVEDVDVRVVARVVVSQEHREERQLQTAQHDATRVQRQRPHRPCPLANKVENIDLGHVCRGYGDRRGYG